MGAADALREPLAWSFGTAGRGSDMQRLRRLEQLRARPKALIIGALALFAASLFLPFADGDEFGVSPGLAILLFSILGSIFALVSLLMGLAYLAVPLSLLAARHRTRLAACLVALGLIFPIWFLATRGLYIDASLPNQRILNTGCLCLLSADVLMLTAWIVISLVSGAEKGDAGLPNESRRA
jgi:hypothetical protein